MSRAPMLWYKSSYSSDSGNCVEVAHTPEGVRMRDSKDPDGPQLRYAASVWRGFVEAVRAGEFDPPGDDL